MCGRGWEGCKGSVHSVVDRRHSTTEAISADRVSGLSQQGGGERESEPVWPSGKSLGW